MKFHVSCIEKFGNYYLWFIQLYQQQNSEKLQVDDLVNIKTLKEPFVNLITQYTFN